MPRDHLDAHFTGLAPGPDPVPGRRRRRHPPGAPGAMVAPEAAKTSPAAAPPGLPAPTDSLPAPPAPPAGSGETPDEAGTPAP